MKITRKCMRKGVALCIVLSLTILMMQSVFAVAEDMESESSYGDVVDREVTFNVDEADAIEIELEILESMSVDRTPEEEKLWLALREAERAAGDFPYDCPAFVEARNAALVTGFYGFYDEFGVFRETAGPGAYKKLNPLSRSVYEPGYIYDIGGVMTAFVDTWSTTAGGRVGFIQAYETPTIDKIVMVNHIDAPSGTAGRPVRSVSIEIDGGGFSLRFADYARLVVNNPGANNQQLFHIHNIFLGTHGNRSVAAGIALGELRPGTTGGSGLASANWNWAVIGHNHPDAFIENDTTPNWSFRIGNMATLAHGTVGDPKLGYSVHTEQSCIARIIRGNGAEITIYGEVTLNTNSENFYTGKILVEDGARYIGHTHWRQYSTIWFIGNGWTNAFPPNSTAAKTDIGNLTGIYDGEGNPLSDASFSFVVGRGAYIRLSGNGTVGGQFGGFPMIYENYRRIVIGEDAHFSVSAHRTAGVGFSRNGQGFVANPGSFINLTTNLVDTPVIATTSRGWYLPGTGQELIPGQPGGGQTGGGVNTNGLLGCYVIIQEGAELFITGDNHSGVHGTYPGNVWQSLWVHSQNGGHANLGGIIHMPGGTAAHPNRFIVNRPKRFDLINTNNGRHGNQNAGPIFSQHPHFQVEFNNTDILLWETGGDVNRNPDLMFLDEEQFAFSGTALDKYTTITNARLQEVLRRPGVWASNNFNPNLSQDDRLNPHLSPSQRSGNMTMGLNNYRRMAAINGDPIFRYDFSEDGQRGGITDADYMVRGHVLIGFLPVNEGVGNIDGEIRWTPVYAGAGIGRVWMTDTHGVRFVPRLIDALGIELPTPLPTDIAVEGATTTHTGAIEINTLDGDPNNERPFQKAGPGANFISTIARIDVEGQWREAKYPARTRVIPVTPPPPAILTTVSSTPIVGVPSPVEPATQPGVYNTSVMVGGIIQMGEEFGNISAQVRRNGTVVNNPSLVMADGMWTLDLQALTPTIAIGDVFDIVLDDGSGPLPAHAFWENDWQGELMLSDDGGVIPWSLAPNPPTGREMGNQNPIAGTPTIGTEPIGIQSFRRADINHPYAGAQRDFRFHPALRFVIELDPGRILLQVPTHFNFGQHPVLSTEQVRMIPVTNYTGEPLGVFDDRTIRSEWQVNVSMPADGGFEHTSGDEVQVQFRRAGTVTNIIPGGGSVPVYGTHLNTVDFHSIWDSWYVGAEGDGLFINVPQGSVRLGTYEGVLNWTLINGPVN